MPIMRLFPLLALTQALMAQVNKSNLTGVVRDSSGGVVAGAVVRTGSKSHKAALRNSLAAACC